MERWRENIPMHSLTHSTVHHANDAIYSLTGLNARRPECVSSQLFHSSRAQLINIARTQFKAERAACAIKADGARCCNYPRSVVDTLRAGG